MAESRMSLQARLSCMEATLERHFQLIAAAESRIGLVLALDTAMLGALAALSPSIRGWVVGSALPAFAAAVLLLASLLFLSFSSFPRIRGPRDSLIYFQGIASRSRDAYIREVSNLSEESYCTDLAEQCHRNAEIAQAKFSWLHRSLVAMYIGLLAWLWAVYELYRMRQ